ncbi:MAG: Asp23/Gls24 family envelope stress response protein [Oscillospiraceae bacterium]|jgi:uncharacterized alkaline shock family protein YloU|nr:Asp23/Gls24 family envelope stress response protein [Oscillospiraceae bacterium]
MVTNTTPLGTITISPDVFTTLAGDAATNCFGVAGMTLLSVTDGLVHLLRRESMRKGVRVAYNDDNTISVELHIAVGRDVNIPEICKSIQAEVRYKLESAAGIGVRAVDVFVDSMILG